MARLSMEGAPLAALRGLLAGASEAAVDMDVPLELIACLGPDVRLEMVQPPLRPAAALWLVGPDRRVADASPDQIVVRVTDMDAKARRVLVTRPLVPGLEPDPLVMAIERLGETPVHYPFARAVFRYDQRTLAAFEQVGRYHWLAITSQLAWHFFLEGLQQAGGDLRMLQRTRIAAVGAKTSRAIEGSGLRVDVCPEQARAVALVEALAGRMQDGPRVLYPRSELAAPALEDGLRAAGAEVTAPVVYGFDPLMPPWTPLLTKALAGGDIAAAVFASGSAARMTVRQLGPGLMRRLPAFALGPETAAVLRDELGFERVALAPTARFEALAGLLHDWLERDDRRWDFP